MTARHQITDKTAVFVDSFCSYSIRYTCCLHDCLIVTHQVNYTDETIVKYIKRFAN